MKWQAVGVLILLATMTGCGCGGERRIVSVSPDGRFAIWLDVYGGCMGATDPHRSQLLVEDRSRNDGERWLRACSINGVPRPVVRWNALRSAEIDLYVTNLPVISEPIVELRGLKLAIRELLEDDARPTSPVERKTKGR